MVNQSNLTFILIVNELILTSLRILLKLFTFPLAIEEFCQGQGIRILLNKLKNCENEIKLPVLQIFEAISEASFLTKR